MNKTEQTNVLVFGFRPTLTDRWCVRSFTNLPALVMIISVPASWNFFHSSLS